MKKSSLLIKIRFKYWLLFSGIRRGRWRSKIKLWWSRLWIREDEFHNSLSMDPFAIIVMNEEERGKYVDDLIRRRQIAHEKDR